MKNFAITGVAGFVAPRHLKAIADTGNRLVAAVDPHDAVGILDRLCVRRPVLHRVRALRSASREAPPGSGGRARALCVRVLAELPARRAYPTCAARRCRCDLREAAGHQPVEPRRRSRSSRAKPVAGSTQCCSFGCTRHWWRFANAASGTARRRHVVQLAYLTARGRWYDVSWKGVEERSGGIVINIGIHFFDLLVWLFGPVERAEVHLREGKRAAGTLVLANADVAWYLSAESSDLPFTPEPGKKTTFRSIIVDGEQLEFSDGFTDLHTRVYEEVLAGRGFGIADARPSIELSHRIRHAPIPTPSCAEFARAPCRPWPKPLNISNRADTKSYFPTSARICLTSTKAARSATARRSGISATS